jgi:DNA modification methylase
MKPYFENKLTRIIHADCRDVMPQFNSGTVVTDPPFNIGYHYATHIDAMDVDDYQDMLRSACRLPSVVVHYPEQLCALSWALEEIPERIVAWVYPSNTARQWRGIAWFGCRPDFKRSGQPYKNPTDKRVSKLIAEGKQCRLYDWWEVNQVKNVSAEKTNHPCQMPLEVMLRILKITNCDLVIDPFCGSGTTLVAAQRLGIPSIGIDTDESYCEIAAKRLQL